MDTTTDRFMLDTSKGDNPMKLFFYAREKAKGELLNCKKELMEEYEKNMSENVGRKKRQNKYSREYEKQYDNLHEEYETLIEKIELLLNIEESIDKLTFKKTYVLKMI
jgi:hypothetical protein